MTVGLRMCRGGEVVPDSQLRAEFMEVSVVKLLLIVSDYELAYYGLLNEVTYVALGDCC